MSKAEGSVGSNLVSKDEEPAKSGFFIPETESRIEDGEKNADNSETKTDSINVLPLLAPLTYTEGGLS